MNELRRGIENDKLSISIIVDFEDKEEAESFIENQGYFVVVSMSQNNKTTILVELR